MESLSDVQFEELYPGLHAAAADKLRSEGQEPDDFILTTAHHNDERVEASYYPRVIADAHEQGSYSVPNYLWLALDAGLSEGQPIDLNLRVLEDGGWIG